MASEQQPASCWWNEPPLGTHRASLGTFLHVTWAMWLFAGLFGVIALIGFHSPSKENPGASMILVVVCTFGAIAMAAWPFARWAGLIKRVDVHAAGLAWEDSAGEQMAGWDDIRDVLRTEILVNGAVSTRQVVIKTFDGHEAIFTFALAGWKELADHIQQEVTMRQSPQALAAFRAGKTVWFGTGLAVSLEGLSLADRTVLWADVRGVRVANGYFVISHADGEPLGFAIGETPNFSVFLKLLEASPAGLAIL